MEPGKKLTIQILLRTAYCAGSIYTGGRPRSRGLKSALDPLVFALPVGDMRKSPGAPVLAGFHREEETGAGARPASLA